MTHQLMLSAKKKWRKLDGQNRLPEIIQGVEFRDGIKHEIEAADFASPTFGHSSRHDFGQTPIEGFLKLLLYREIQPVHQNCAVIRSGEHQPGENTSAYCGTDAG
jgi:hypothetical protein